MGQNGKLGNRGRLFFSCLLVNTMISCHCLHHCFSATSPLSCPHMLLFIPSLLYVPVLDCPLVAVSGPSLFSSFLSPPPTVQDDYIYRYKSEQTDLPKSLTGMRIANDPTIQYYRVSVLIHVVIFFFFFLSILWRTEPFARQLAVGSI